MSVEFLNTIVAALISLAFSYWPGLKAKFDPLRPEQKRLVMLGLLSGVSLLLFGLSCLGLAADLGILLTCDRPGVVGLLRILGLAIMVNQSTFLISPKLPLKKPVVGWG